MNIKTIHRSIALVLEKYGFTGKIELNVLHGDNYIGIYYFKYEGERYHIIAAHTDDILFISLNIEIVKSMVEWHIKIFNFKNKTVLLK